MITAEATAENKIGKVKQAIKDGQALFERHQAIKERCDKCGETKERDAWWSFKHEAISADGALYNRLSDIIHESKTGENYAYNWVVDALDALDEIIDDEEDDADALADAELNEYIDGAVNCYTAGLTAWLASSVYNIYHLEEAAKEGNAENLLMVAQYKAIEEIFCGVREALIDYINTDKEEDAE